MTTQANLKRALMAGGIAISIVGVGLLGGTGTALADGTNPDTGTYNELLGVEKPAIQAAPITGTHHGIEGSYDDLQNILDDDGFQAASP